MKNATTKKRLARKTAGMVSVALAAVISMSASAFATTQENDPCNEAPGVYCVDCGELGYVPDDGLGTPATFYERDFSYMFYMYPNDSYFSDTGKACTCHSWCTPSNSGSCTVYNGAIQCAGFARKVYYETHGRNVSSLTSKNMSLTAENAKNLFLNTAQGTYLYTKTKSGMNHYITIITTSDRGLTVYHANYGGPCLVKYENYTWENFAAAFPYLYSYAK